MSLIINLDSRKVEINGLEFEVKPLNQSAMSKFASLSQGKITKNKIKENEAHEIFNDPEFNEFFAKTASQHCKLLNSFQIKEKGKLRDGTVEDLILLDTAQAWTYKMGLVKELMSASNLTENEVETVKK